VNNPSAEANNTPGPISQQQNPYAAPFKPTKHCQKAPTSISDIESKQLDAAIAHMKADMSNCVQMVYASSAPSSEATKLPYITLHYR
jgi:hypothetical protein